MPKDVLMIIHTMGSSDPSDNDRFTYLASLIVGSREADVEIISSQEVLSKQRHPRGKTNQVYQAEDLHILHQFRPDGIFQLHTFCRHPS